VTIPLGPFDLIEPIGTGGIGVVWKGVHRAQGVGVAVKVLTAQNARKKGFRKLFREEVRAVAALDHPGVVLVFDVGEVDHDAADASGGRLVAGSPYLAMELASGGSLDTWPKPGSWSALRDLLLGLLDALAHAHARGVVHRDLKPGNVLVCTQGDPRPGMKLSDFGLAWVMDDEAADGRQVCGTPRYMAPEQFRADWRAFGPWTDLYALACMAWELVTGSPPWPETDAMVLGRHHQHDPLPRFQPLYPVPDGFAGWLAALLEKSTGARAQRAADAAFALRLLGDAASPVTARPSLPPASAPTLVALWSHAGEDDPTFVSPGDGLEDVPTEEEAQPWPADLMPAFAPPPAPFTWRMSAGDRASMRLVGAGLGLYGLREIPVVGREPERDKLWSALRGVLDSRKPRMVVLQGASGSGTTRLAAWLSERAHEVGAAEVVKAVHQPFGGPRDGVAPAVARHLRVAGLTGPGLASRVAQGLRELGGDVEADTAALCPALEGASHAAAERWGPLRRYLRLLARRRAVILWLDDAQWGADALGLAKQLLLPDPEPFPLLIVATVREDALVERPAEAKAVQELVAGGASRVEVRPLAAQEAARLARELLGLDSALAREVGRRSAGNPMFAVQLVQDWVQRGVLVPGARGFQLREGERADLPDDIHGLWAARVVAAAAACPDPDAAGFSLEIAAVLGNEIDAAEWEATCAEAGIAVSEGLPDLLLARRLATPLEGGWTFAHGLLRESLERAAREGGRAKRWHRAAAVVLERGEPTGYRLGRMGMHWLEAGEPERAIKPLFNSSAVAEQGGYLSEGQRLIDAWERAMREAGVPESDGQWARGLWMRAMLAVTMGRAAEGAAAGRVLEEKARKYRWDGHLGRAARIQATAAVMAGDLENGVVHSMRAVDIARATGDVFVEATALNSLGDIARQRGDWEGAEGWYQQALALHPRIPKEAAPYDAMQGLALVYKTRGRMEESRRLLAEVIAYADRVERPNLKATALNGIGEVARAEGKLDEAEGLYRTAVAILRNVGPERSVVPRMNLCLVLLMRGRFTEARPMLQVDRARLEARGRKGLASGCAAMLLACAAAEGDPVTFDRDWIAVTSFRAKTGFVDADVAWAVELAGDQWSARGDAERARRAWTEARAMCGALADLDGYERLSGKLSAR
jgi:serine/threonine protein kinase/tetratricopeptide (TPR) repeat protein